MEHNNSIQLILISGRTSSETRSKHLRLLELTKGRRYLKGFTKEMEMAFEITVKDSQNSERGIGLIL